MLGMDLLENSNYIRVSLHKKLSFEKLRSELYQIKV